jgi:hypothetical protein
MPYNIELPDGTVVEDIPDEVQPQEAKRQLALKFPQFSETKPQSGIIPSFMAGLRGGAGEAVQGVGALINQPGIEAWGKQQAQAAQQQYQPSPDAGLLEKGAGLVGGVAGRYVAPTAAGAAAAAMAPEAALAGIGAGTAAFFGANAPIHMGENIVRQKEQGQQPNYATAIIGGLAQGAIDSLGGALVAGPMRAVIGKTAMETAQALAPKVLSGELTLEAAQAQISGFLKNMAQATAHNAVLGPAMMIGDEAIRRAAAEQGVTDPAAIEQYKEAAKMGVAMAPFFGAWQARGAGAAARGKLQLTDIERQAAALKAQQAGQATPTEEAPAGPMMQQQLPGMPQEAPAQPQTDLFGQPVVAPPTEMLPEQRQASALQFAQKQSEAAGLLEDNQQAMSDAAAQGDAAAVAKLAAQRAALQQEHDDWAKQLKEIGGYTDAAAEAEKTQKALVKARKQLTDMAGTGFDPEKGAKLAAKITELETKAQTLGAAQQAIPPEQYGMFGGKSETGQEFGGRLEQQARQEELARAQQEVAQQAAEEARVNAVAPEAQALQRIAQRPTPTVGTTQISPLVDKLVESLPQGEAPQPTGVPGRVIPGIAPDMTAPQTLRAQLSYANATGNKEQVNLLRKQLGDLNEPTKEQVNLLRKQLGDLNEPTTEVPPENALAAEQTTRAAGVEGALSPAARMENRATQLAQQQLGAYDRLAGFISDAKYGNIQADKPDILKRTEELRRTAVGTALNEIDARRAANGQEPLTTDQQLKAVRDIEAPLDELVSRSQRLLEEQVPGAPAQMRGHVLVRGAEETSRPEKDGRTFGSYEAAAQVLRGEMRDAIDKHTALTPRPVPEKFKGTPTRIEAVLRRTAEAQALPTDEVFRRAAQSPDAAPEDKALMVRVDAVRDQLGATGQDVAREQALRVANGLPVDAKYELQTLLALHERAMLQDQGQRELFSPDTAAATERILKPQIEQAKTQLAQLNAVKRFNTIQDAAAALKQKTALQQHIQALATQLRGALQDKAAMRKEQARQQGEVGFTRATPANFQRALQSGEVFKLKEQAAELRKQADFMAKRNETLARKAAEAEAFRVKVEAAKKSPVEAAQQALETALATGAEKAKMSRKLQSQHITARLWAAGEAQRIAAGRDKLKQGFDNVLERLTLLEQAHEWHKAELDAGRAPKTNRTELAKIEKQLPGVWDDVLQGSKALDRVEEQLAAAQALHQRTMNPPPIERALVREGTQAQARIDAAQERLKTAHEEEKSAANGLRLMQEEAAKKPKEPGPLAGIEARVTGTTRVFRDTSDPEVQRTVKKVRTAIAQQEGLYEKAKAEGDTEAAQAAQRAVDGLYSRLYAALDNAPLRKITSEDAALLAKHAEYEAAQNRAFEAEQAASRAEKGEPAPKLTARRKGPVVTSTSPTPTTMRTGTAESKAGATTAPIGRAARKEGVAKVLSGSVLEDIAKKRAELAEIQRQLKYMADNKATNAEGKAKQNAARKALAAQKVAVEKELKTLTKQHGEMARQEDAVQKALYKEKREILRGQLAEEKGVPEATAKETEGYNETTQTPLTNEGAAALKDGRILDVLGDIAKTSPHDWMRAIAEKLQPLMLRTKLQVVDGLTHNGKSVPGLYEAHTNTVNIDSRINDAETVVHEATHAAVNKQMHAADETLTPVQRKAKADIKALFERVKDNPALEGEYGKKDVLEFVAEAQSNKTFRDALDSIKIKASNDTVWEKLKNFFSRLLFGEDRMVSALDRASAITEKLFAPSKAYGGEATPSLFRARQPIYANNDLKEVGALADKLIARERPWAERVRNNLMGLNFRTQFIDQFAPLERVAQTSMDALQGTQMMMHLRAYGQRMHQVAQAISTGVPQLIRKTRADGQYEYMTEAVPGANLKNVVHVLSTAKEAGNADAASRLFTLYMAAIRAKRVGLETLNFSKEVTQADLDSAMRKIENIPGLKDKFEVARAQYNQYNRDLMQFAVQSGIVSKAHAAELLKADDYIPYYRERDGVVQLMIGSETPVRIGNIKDNPELKELVGGEQPIMDFLTSSVQNTSMLVNASMKNIATKNAMYALKSISMAKIGEGDGPPSGNVVRFHEDGIRKFAAVDTDSLGVPSDLLVKGMAGIPTMLPAYVRFMGIPARLLRRSITANPAYMARQLFRDSTAATMTSGANIVPVLGALQQIGKGDVLNRRGITGGQIFSGTTEDMSRLLREMQEGRPGWAKAFSKLEAMSMEADALTRRAQYESYLKQGLSEMEATYMSLESMNFTKRGVSPSLHMLGTLVPFVNAQIQGLDVMYKALAGKMPMNDRLNIQHKMFVRGALMMASSLAYAALTQDDPAYKNATPDQKYASWFVRVPGVEQPVRIPVPFEPGYIFKALPEAIYNMIVGEHPGEEAKGALRYIALQILPGGTSWGIPQAVRPLIETAMNKSFYNFQNIETPQEQTREPWERYRDNTSEAAKFIGKYTGQAGISPIQVENLIRGYTGGLGLAALQALNVFASPSVESAMRRTSDLPIIGSLFQPNDAGGIINATYDHMLRFEQAKKTFDDLIAKGDIPAAKQFVNENSANIAMDTLTGSFKQQMGELTKYEGAIRASSKTPEEKRAMLDKIREAKIKLATAIRAASDRTERQVALY